MTNISDQKKWTSPQEVREKQFSTQFRGLDQGAVYDYLDTLADDLQSVTGDLEGLVQENRRLRSELAAATENPLDKVTDQAVMLFSQAQQVADSLIDEAVQRARDLLSTARSQQRDIMAEAHEAAQEAAERYAATGVSSVGWPEDEASARMPMSEVAYVRTFAKVAQVQLRAVLEALNDQVDKLSEVPGLEDPDPLGAPPASGPLPRRSEEDALPQAGMPPA